MVGGGLTRSVVVDVFIVLGWTLTGQLSRAATTHLPVTSIDIDIITIDIPIPDSLD